MLIVCVLSTDEETSVSEQVDLQALFHRLQLRQEELKAAAADRPQPSSSTADQTVVERVSSSVPSLLAALNPMRGDADTDKPSEQESSTAGAENDDADEMLDDVTEQKKPEPPVCQPCNAVLR